MKLTPTRTGLFLAISALLFAPVALAQDAATPQQPSQTPTPTELDAVQVFGEYIPAPLLESFEVISALTKEDLKRLGDGNAVEALTRVAGLSINQGKLIYVRGPNERYYSALLNCSPPPHPQPPKPVVSLEL